MYDECFDACQLAYLYSLYECSINPKQKYEGYVVAYIKKVTRIYFVGALTIYNDTRNLYKENNFRAISMEDYRI